MKCDRELSRKIAYCSLDDSPPMPCVDIVLHNPKSRISVADTAEIDTGFDHGTLLTKELVELLNISFEDSARIIMPDKSIITCKVAKIFIKVEGRWFETKAHYSEDILVINPILGREVINKLNVCLRGEDGELFIT